MVLERSLCETSVSLLRRRLFFFFRRYEVMMPQTTSCGSAIGYASLRLKDGGGPHDWENPWQQKNKGQAFFPQLTKLGFFRLGMGHLGEFAIIVSLGTKVHSLFRERCEKLTGDIPASPIWPGVFENGLSSFFRGICCLIASLIKKNLLSSSHRPVPTTIHHPTNLV